MASTPDIKNGNGSTDASVIAAAAQSDYNARRAQQERLRAAGIDPYPAEVQRPTHQAADLLAQFDGLQGSMVTVAGRLGAIRRHGGVAFSHISDHSGQIQALLNRKVLGPDFYELVMDTFSRGDFVGVSGVLDRTGTGEVSVMAERISMLAKALRSAPEKLGDPERQQRERYLHTLVDTEALKRFRTRGRIIQLMREHFINVLGCTEVETPVMDSTYGGALAKPFTAHHNALGTDVYLRIAPELYLKRYTVGGFYEGVFEFARNFRNEGMDRTHSPEFTMVELYKTYWNYRDQMAMTEELYSKIALAIHGTTQVPYGEHLIDYAPPWRRLSIYDGLREKLGIEPTTISDEALERMAHSYGIEQATRGDRMLKLFDLFWEKELIQPTFIVDYPTDTSALAKRHPNDPSLTQRFEIMIAGMEAGNSYSELNDPIAQEAAFRLEAGKREGGDAEAMQFDQDYINAQEFGMPPQAGIGLSIDRLTMLMTDTDHIRQAVYFPTLRPKA